MKHDKRHYMNIPAHNGYTWGYFEKGLHHFVKGNYVIDRASELAKQLRGANRKEAQGIVEALAEIQQSTYNATEEGLDNIRSAEKELKK